MGKLSFLIIISIVSLTETAASWEATRNGPLIGPGSTIAPTYIENLGTGTSPSLTLSRRTVEYPYESGARLGDSWDFVTNSRLYSQCIEYGSSATDGYQQATLDFKRSIDQETLSVALNINTAGHAKGSYGGFGGSAKGSFGLNSSYKFNSKDDVIVAHASVINGASYLTAQNLTKRDQTIDGARPATGPQIAGVRLSPAALWKLGRNNLDLANFRRSCGDGFVAAIGTGADLYLLYRFSHVDKDTRVKITSSMEASGGMGDFFSAGGSFNSSIDFQKLISDEKLGIYYVQKGGKIASLPTKLEDISVRVAALSSEAFGNGRPLYVVVVPYSELSNWPKRRRFPLFSDFRTSLIRYAQRIESAYFELQSVVADFRNIKDDPKSNEYLHEKLHGLRAVDYAKLNDILLLELRKISQYIEVVDGPCSRNPNDTVCSDAMRELNRLYTDNPLNFDDFRFLIKLPVPNNALFADEITKIVNPSEDRGGRKFRLSLAIYRHWIERTSNERCLLFFECLDSESRKKQYAAIKTTLGM